MENQSMDVFRGIDLNDSFVLGWQSNNAEISFTVEASIWPESVLYQTPKDNEYTCYRKCLIKFTDFTSYSGLLNQSAIQPVCDPDGSFDYGNIDSLISSKNGFQIIGQFGNVEIIGGKVQLKPYT